MTPFTTGKLFRGPYQGGGMAATFRAVQLHLWGAMLGLLAVVASAPAAAPPDDQTLARFRQIQETIRLNRQGMALYQVGKWPEATRVFANVLRMREVLYPRERYPHGHPALAQSLNNLGYLLKLQQEYTRAEPLQRRAMQMYEALYPPARYPNGHPALAGSVKNLALLYEEMGELARAEPLFRRALRIYETLYPRARFPQGHPELASNMTILASLYQTQGQYTKAEPLFRRALEMYETFYPWERYSQGHPDLAASLSNLALLYQDQGQYARAEPLFRRALAMFEALYPRERNPRGHPQLAQSINNLALLHLAQGDYATAETLFRRALRMRERLYPAEQYPQGHPALANSLNNLAALHQAQGEYTRAEPLCARALQIYEGLYPRSRYPSGHPDLARGLNNLAAVYKDQWEYRKAETLFTRALRMNEALYPQARYAQGHPYLANTINNLAFLHQAQGEFDRAERLFLRAVQMYEALYPRAAYPEGHRDLANSLNNLALLHQGQGKYARAEPLYRRALQMREALFPRARYPHGHPDLAQSISSLAFLHQAQGEFNRAEALLRRALRMYEALHPQTRSPQGHPDLAASINNLAFLHQCKEEYARAETLYRRALRMYEALYPPERYPQGHPELAQNITSLASLYRVQTEFTKAEPLFRRALVMYQALYPRSRYSQGHPRLATLIDNLALLYLDQGEFARADPLAGLALRMREALFPRTRYPRGHPDLADSLNKLAFLNLYQGQSVRAAPVFRRALEMYGASAAALAAAAPEATALNYLARLPMTRDGYLWVTRAAPHSNAYPAVWQSKAALSRLYERRHLAEVAAGSREARTLWAGIIALRRERERLVLAPSDPTRASARHKRLEDIDEEIRAREADLLPHLPALKRSEEHAKATPADLQKALPAGTALVDLVRYLHFEHDPRVPGIKGARRTPHYVAFVVTSQAVARVELGKAQPIEEMLELWRRALQEDSPSEPDYAARVHALLWAPLLAHLPARASVVHVCPDAGLNRVPWTALRNARTGRILIEDHAVAVVPHGVMLLDRLTEPKSRQGAGSALLAMGGVAYDRKPIASSQLALRGPVGETVKWTPLAGTQKELKQILDLVGSRRVVRLEGEAAGAEALLAELPRAQTAHLATHGFFADARFRIDLQLDEKLFQSTEFDSGLARRTGAGSRSPMVLSGLVCSGANLPDTPNRGVLTAEAICGLDLRKMKLAVLSACETGLGERAGGEAVYGLVRAFHVAGARDVAATLWKVDDEATCALMVLFYRQLWQEKQPPIEALRRAQLALYHNPGQIKAWSQGRGPDPRKVVPGSSKPSGTSKPTGKAHARLWAAFILSGLGR
jgi:tetratricopeptide (TPR) repeat protein